MSWRDKNRRSSRSGPVPMIERFAEAYQLGEIRLGSFSPAELASVTLDPAALSPEVRGPALQTADPLLAKLAGNGAGNGSAGAGQDKPAEPADAATLAAAAAGLARRGYLRPGFPEPSDRNVPDAFAGWAADQAGGRPHAVAIGGDLGIITRMRSQPYWVAEASASPSPASPDPASVPRHLVGRMYAAYRPQAALTEVPGGPGGNPNFAVLWQNRAVLALLTWCGIELAELRDERHRAEREPVPDMPTADVAEGFTSLTMLRIAHPLGQEIEIKTLIAAAGAGKHWMLTGERAETAVRVSVDQLGEQVDVLLRPPGGGEPGQDGGESAPPGAPGG